MRGPAHFSRLTACRLAILAGTASTLALATAAYGQDAEANAADVPNEIIVTAQKREQNLQEVPIAVQVVSDEFLDDLAADNIADVSQFIPGLDVSANSPTQPNYKIRGVNTSDFGVGTDPAVGVYVDGIYSARSGAAVLALGDVERIEVLKGPQGTLFGRNAAAGAVSIITKKPVDRFEGRVQARYGNYDKRRVEGMINLPVGEGASLRVNALVNRRDGLYRDAATGEDLSREDNWAVRGAFRVDISPQTDATLTFTHDDLDQDARPAIGIVAIPGAPGIPVVPANPANYLNPFTAPVFNDVVDNHETRRLDEISLAINHDFGQVALSSITSFRKFRTENREDEDGTNRIDLYFDTNNREYNKSWYQELRLSGQTGQFDWLVGASYFDERAEQISDTLAFTDSINTTLGNVAGFTPFTDIEFGVLVPFGIPATLLGHEWREAMFNRGDYSAFAVYGDVIWAVSDRVNVTVGGRYTRDKKKFQWLNGPREAPGLDDTLAFLDTIGILGLIGVSPQDFAFDVVFDQSARGGIACDNGVNVTEGVPCILDRTYSNFSPRAVIDYKATDNVFLFASFSKGYKAGGFNSVEIASEFQNEDVTNFEVGMKSQFPAAGLTFNVSGFHYTYDGKQSIKLAIPAGGTIPQYLVQTSDDQAWGADLELVWRPLAGLRLFGNAQYIDATFKNRVLDNGKDISGEPTGEPKWQAAFGGRYEFGLGSAGFLAFQAVHSYRGKARLNSESLAQGGASGTSRFNVNGAQNRTDLRLSWSSPSEKVVVGLYANNVFDNRYVTGINNITAGTLGTPFVSISPPRFVGADVTVNF